MDTDGLWSTGKRRSFLNNVHCDLHNRIERSKGGTNVEPTYKDEIFTKRVRAGKRTYFFDVKSTKSEKDFYITITESKRVGDEEYEKHKIFLYKEDFDKFAEALQETVTHVRGHLLAGVPVEATTEERA
jgi:hypothetical protein